MIGNGDLCTREERERVGCDKTRDTVLVSEDLEENKEEVRARSHFGTMQLCVRVCRR